MLVNYRIRIKQIQVEATEGEAKGDKSERAVEKTENREDEPDCSKNKAHKTEKEQTRERDRKRREPGN